MRRSSHRREDTRVPGATMITLAGSEPVECSCWYIALYIAGALMTTLAHAFATFSFLTFLITYTYTTQAKRRAEQGRRRSAGWPEDQRSHRERRTGRRWYQEVLLLARYRKGLASPCRRRSCSRRCMLPAGVLVIVVVYH